jgi:hypothetical protein
VTRDVERRLNREHEIERDEVERVPIGSESSRVARTRTLDSGESIREFGQLGRHQRKVDHLGSEPPRSDALHIGVAHTRKPGAVDLERGDGARTPSSLLARHTLEDALSVP